MGKNLKDYLAYWGLAAAPFDHLDKDITQLKFPSEWQSLMERLLFFCERSGSLLTIITEPGHCKTSLARWLYHSLDPLRHEVLMFSIFQDQSNAGWLVPRLCKLANIEVAEDEDPIGQLAQAIEELCIEQRTMTIIIDEAHKLKTASSFQDIHSLISIQSMVRTRLNIVLFGNPELLQLIETADAMRNRVSMAATIPPLSSDQIHNYLNQHFQKIGLSPNIISFDALPQLHHLSHGWYSRLNTLVENCLIEAFLRREKTIHSETVLAAGRFLPNIGQALNSMEASDQQLAVSATPYPIRPGSSDPQVQSAAAESTRSQSIELKRLFYKSGDSKNKKNSAR